MKILLSYIVASGGMETLNRTRGQALRRHGVDCHLLYSSYGAGLHNAQDCPVYVTDNDHEIYHLLHTQGFQAAVVSSNYLMLERLRGMGFTGRLIYEAQGLGQIAEAARIVDAAAPYILTYADALLYPPTSHLVQLFQRFPTKLHFCFPNCVDTAMFQFRPHGKTGYPIIGWVGRLEPNKNWRECLEIVYRLTQHQPDLRLWFFEDSNLSVDSERIAFHEMIAQLGLSSHIDLFQNAPNSEMPYYYSVIGESGGFLLSTSVLEGFGYAVAEAMSCRCALLSTDSDGVRAFITHNATGKFYALGNMDDAVQQALELMRNDPLRESIRAQGRAHIEALLNSDGYAGNFISMIARIG